MKCLDDQVPSGYFDGLPEKALARLEASMQTGPGSFDREQPSVSNAVPPKIRDEDSGLHDIRNLAQSTKQRLSNKRVGSQGPAEEDVLAQTSAGWKAVALPEPAKMVSLPSIDELPSKAEVLAKEKAPAPAPAQAQPATAAAAPEVRAPFSRPAQKKKSGARTLAFVGIGLAAAAGVTLYVAMGNKDAATKEAPAARAQVAVSDNAAAKPQGPAPTAVPAPAAEPPPPPKEEVESAGSAVAPEGAAAVGGAADEGKPEKAVTTVHRGYVTKKGEKKEKEKVVEETKTPPPDTKKGSGSGSGNKEENEPSFDALLKQAGYQEQKKDQKPKLDKKELTGDDFKAGMSSVASRAQACYKGTQGTAKITVMVAPSGKVSSVTVSGQFAGKPEADCVTNAVKGASFPAWDGAPQRFTYVYLLSE